MDPSTSVAYKRLASLISHKTAHPYTETMKWLRCHLSFSLLRSATTAIRGTRTPARQNIQPESISLAMGEGNIL